jgi:predicted transcriptional regulator YheO
MNKKEAFVFLNRLAEGLSKTFGNSCETVIHDMKNKKNSITAIYNGHVTGRKIGDGLDILGTNKEVSDFFDGIDIVNCQGKTADGKLVKTSTFHLMGEGYHYTLGINFDYTILSIAESAIKELTKVGEGLEDAMNEFGENRLKDIFEDCLGIVGKPVSIMNKEDRVRIITLLKEKNAFSFQKSIPFVSEKLNISRYTIYNYLKELNGKPPLQRT